MSIVYVCSDFHLGHYNISKRFRLMFDSDKEHDEYFLDHCANTFTKRDTIYCLGDMLLSENAVKEFRKIPGTKILILGNHDLEKSRWSKYKRNIPDLSTCFTGGIFGPIKYKNFWFTHIPMHPNELYGRKNIHGHVHSNTLEDDRYFNVCPENLWTFQKEPFINFQVLKQKLKEDAQ